MSLPPCLGGTLNTSNRNTNTNLYHELLDANLAQQESGGGRVETDDEQLAARLQAEEYGGTTSEGIGGTLNTSNRNTNTNLYHELLDANLAQQESGGGRVETDDEQLAARLQAEEYVKVLIDQVKVLINQVKVQMNNKLIALFVCLKFHQMNKSKNYPANTNFTLLALIDGLLKTHLARSVAPALVGEEAAAALHPHKIGPGMEDFPLQIPPDNFHHGYGGIVSGIGQGLTNLGNWMFGGSNYGTAQPPPMRPYAMHGTAQPTPIPRGMLQPGRTIRGINSNGNPRYATIVSTNHYASPIEVTLRSENGQQATFQILWTDQPDRFADHCCRP
ncbi:hypothetical protein niasHT_002796 [Heterodera trifolii]|uniref:Uncharacterized protein n=1 Tax=Heterodera trifolii TaxID=157864 RepID=A0ABD2MBF8_9BILA